MVAITQPGKVSAEQPATHLNNNLNLYGKRKAEREGQQ